MKRLSTLLIIATVIGTTNLCAQTDRATLMLGGGASFQATDGYSVFVLNPNVGVFVANNFAVGLQANIVSADNSSAWALGPFARYYFGKNEKGKPFGQATLTLGGSDGSDVSLGGGLTAGYAFFLNQSIALEAAASYFRIDDSGLFVLGVGFQIHFKRSK
jgi:hypothetical protein